MSPEKVVIEKYLRLNFSATNNDAAYETLLVGMTMHYKKKGFRPRLKNTAIDPKNAAIG